MPDPPTIESRFKADDSDRQGSLEEARLAAALSKPWVLPPQGQNANDPLPRNYQSVGSRGSTNLVGRLLLALYPPNLPWFILTPTPEFLAFGSPDQVQALQQQLFLYGQLLTGKLESMSLDPEDDRGQFIGFRSHKRKVMEQVIITGDALERMDSDYRMTLFRRDMYVTRRDSSARVLYHITKETKDPKELPDDMLAKANLAVGTMDAPVKDRMQDLYTLVEYNPRGRDWTVTQEMNGQALHSFDESVSSYFSTPFELVGEDYGRGFIEQNLGDLFSLDEISKNRLNMLSMVSKQLIALDQTSTIRDDDLRQEPGNVVRRAQVKGGVLQDLATIGFQDIRDYQMLISALQDLRTDLFKAFLQESETTRNAERVTTAEIRRNVFEIESALGGVYASVADEQQRPLIRRLIHQFNDQASRETGENVQLPTIGGRSATQVVITTGLTALAQEAEADKLLAALSILQTLGPQALERVDMAVAVDVALRQIGFHAPGLIKSQDQIDAERAQNAQQALALQAGQQAIESAGSIAETQASIAPRRPAA